MSAPRDGGTHPLGPIAGERRALSVAQVAGKLEHRLYLSEPTAQAIQDGCGLALRHGLSSVIARPEVVPAVGLHLAGTPIGVVTIPGWRDDHIEPLPTRVLLAEARRLAADGATDLGVVADLGRLGQDDARRFADDLTALVDAMRRCGARVRVVLDTEGVTPDATAAACELFAATGAWLVQGGSWQGAARTGLSRIQLMRAALPDTVRLKWTFPVRSLDSMMICVAEGVDRFNGDPEAILGHAVRRVSTGHRLIVPVRDIDY